MFYVCRACDRGQSYCGEECRSAKRTADKRRARAVHQASEEGRLDHRDRQREYRDRCRQRTRVTDQGSREVDKPETVAPRTEPTVEDVIVQVSGAGSDRDVAIESTRGILRCAFCNRTSRWVRHDFLRRRRSLPEAAAG